MHPLEDCGSFLQSFVCIVSVHVKDSTVIAGFAQIHKIVVVATKLFGSFSGVHEVAMHCGTDSSMPFE